MWAKIKHLHYMIILCERRKGNREKWYERCKIKKLRPTKTRNKESAIRSQVFEKKGLAGQKYARNNNERKWTALLLLCRMRISLVFLLILLLSVFSTKKNWNEYQTAHFLMYMGHSFSNHIKLCLSFSFVIEIWNMIVSSCFFGNDCFLSVLQYGIP